MLLRSHQTELKISRLPDRPLFHQDAQELLVRIVESLLEFKVVGILTKGGGSLEWVCQC